MKKPGAAQLRAIMFDGLNRCFDLAKQAEEYGHKVHGLESYMPCNTTVDKDKRVSVMVTLKSFAIDGVPV